jgi:hypothetical protein
MQAVNEKVFSDTINMLLKVLECANGKETRMTIAIEIFRVVNENLEILLYDNPKKWTNFAATVYNKTTEFKEDKERKYYDDVNPYLVAIFVNHYMESREFTASFLKNVEDPIMFTKQPVVKALENIKQEDSVTKRPRRNIPVVDYTGMDTLEPCDEYDGITDIWYDENKDSDYNPEEDDEEEFKKKMPFVTVREKRENKQVSIMKLRGREIVRLF